MKTFFFYCSLNEQNYKIFSTQILSLDQLISFFQISNRNLIIEHNRKLYNFSGKYNNSIKNGDMINIITIVGGG